GDRFELPVGSVQCRELAALADGDAVAIELVDQVVGHRFAQVGAAVEQRDEGTAAGEPDGGLTGGVAAADDGDAGAAAELRLGRPGGVEDAQPFELREPLDGRPPVLRARREHDRSCRNLAVLFEPDEVAPVARLERERAVRRRRAGAELPRLRDGPAGQLGAADPGREAEVVLDPPRGPRLAPERGALDEKRVKALRGAVDGGGEAGRAAADDQQVDLLARQQLATDAQRTQHLTGRRRPQLRAAGQPDERRLAALRRLGIPPVVRETIRAGEVDHWQGRLGGVRTDDLDPDPLHALQRLAALDERREQKVA